MSDTEMIEKYKQMEYILHLDMGWLWQDILRWFGSGIVFTLMWLNSIVETIIDKIISLNNFYSSGPMKDFIDLTRPIVWGLFLIALLVLGFQFMFNKIEKRNEVILNVILAVCVIVVIPDLMVNMGKITNAGIEHIKPEKNSLSAELVKSNVADVLYYAENDFNFSSGNGSHGSPPRPMSKTDSNIGTTDFTHANRLTEDTLAYLPYTQKLDFHEDEGWFSWTTEDWVKDLSTSSKELLKHQMVATGIGNGFFIQELEKNAIKMTKIGRETYYRYHVNWGVLIFSLLVTTVALVITVIKIGRSIFDLAFHQVFGMFIAATDLTGGQRTKKILVEIMNTFAVIFLMMLLLKLFILYSVWVNGLQGSIGGFGVLLLLIAGAWALIDAPDIVQRMLGIDAGLRNGWQAAMGAYAGVKTVGALGKGAAKLASAAASTTAGGANFARRTVEGISSKTPGELGVEKEKVKQMPGSGDVGVNDSSLPTGPSDNSGGTNDGLVDLPSATAGFEQGNQGSDISQSPSSGLSQSSAGNGGKPSIPNQTSSKAPQQPQMGDEDRQAVKPMPNSQLNQQSVSQSNMDVPGFNQTTSGILVPESVPRIPASQNSGGAVRSISTSPINLSASQGSAPSSQTQQGSIPSVTVTAPALSSQATPVSKVANAPSISGQGGPATTSSSRPPSGSDLSHGHKVATHPNTIIGGNPQVRRLKEDITRSGNSGFNTGQNIRRVGLGIGRATKLVNRNQDESES